MLDSLKQAGKNIGRELNRAWESLSDGWREILSRCSNALVHYERNDYPDQEISFPHWGLMAVEMEETATELVVRVEMPGVEKENCSIQVIGNTLFVRGVKQSIRETPSSTYYVVERAYGSFERSITLPKNVESDKAQATYVNGVLVIRLPKAISETIRNIPVE